MSTNIFEQYEKTRVDANTFDLTHSFKLTTRFGRLTPCCLIDVLPGDVFNLSANGMCRLLPTIAPVMHRIDMYIHYFFVPNRLLWPNWEDFISPKGDGTAPAPAHPIYPNFQTDSVGASTLDDYFGLPGVPDVGAGKTIGDISMFPYAAYQKIYDDYYRDQNLITAIDVELLDGDNTAYYNSTLKTLRNRAWEHDYFTSALPWAQRGPEALIPMEGLADLIAVPDGGGVIQQSAKTATASLDPGVGNIDGQLVAPSKVHQNNLQAYIDVGMSHKADLGTITDAASIVELRRAFALQSWLEKNARGGARYIEQIAMHFGVESSDKRLQRAEYIGGFRSPVKMSEVLQTSETNTTPQGTMAGHGISIGGSRNYTYRAEEHGWLMGILSIMPKSAYSQGVEKFWLRSDKLDYPWPSFAHIGEQEVLNKEVWIEGNATDNDTFGYVPRYTEMKFKNNRIAGDFRGTLDFWQMSRKFATQPALNQDFIECTPDEVERIFAVQTGDDELLVDVINNVKASRKLPVFGTPKIQ